ncbi:hypothetical protein NHG29_01365 [Aerococcaceae bacterium NML160702]|nr:hypothetical protein [Aerococcaceae bacterium NML190073]MCW6681515.1 hypothetical protein [Aerococcaceae bacterium NML160702]
MSNLLFDEYPLIVSAKLAEIIGLNEAIFIQQLHYWIKKDGKERDGKKWIYKSIKEWQEEDFAFWSDSTIKRIISSLNSSGLIEQSNYNKAGFDKTKWYTINYTNLQSVTNRIGQNDLTHGSDCTDGAGQVELTNTRDYTETTTENNNTTLGHTPMTKTEKEKQLRDDFEKLWKLYPKKEDKERAFKAYKKAIGEGVTNKQIQTGIVGYRRQIEIERKERKFVKTGGNWFSGKLWENDFSSFMPQHREAIQPTDVEEHEIVDDNYDWGELDGLHE